MILSRRHGRNNQQPAPWQGPFAPAPSMAPPRFNPMVRTAWELVGNDHLEVAVATAPTVSPAAPTAAPAAA
ncbi:MAG: hypothetical protein ACRDZ8_06475 [Acidimicrobiales bacterium]